MDEVAAGGELVHVPVVEVAGAGQVGVGEDLDAVGVGDVPVPQVPVESDFGFVDEGQVWAFGVEVSS